ncbi:MAG: preprotein translocase subunit YajC [Micavibrio sp.]|mgnify:FL=1|nr:preprotein translocase subunit YajC [Micavibrio sp.]|tara:strand:- start:425 stop:913 length:489 start_codon:yes stop_codon:yes gene_type:complete
MFISQALAQTMENAAGAGEASAGEAFLLNMLLIGILVILFYMLMIRPQQKRMRSHQEMLSHLGKGSKVVTQGGLVGTIDKIMSDTELLIKVGDVKLLVLRSSIMSTYDEALPAEKQDAELAKKTADEMDETEKKASARPKGKKAPAKKTAAKKAATKKTTKK